MSTTKESFKDKLHILIPVKNKVIFPGAISSIKIKHNDFSKLTDLLMENELPIIAVGTVKQESADIKNLKLPDDIYEYAVSARIIKKIHLKQKEDEVELILQGFNRIKIIEIIQSEPIVLIKADLLEDIKTDDVEVEVLNSSIKELAKRLIDFNPLIPEETSYVIENIPDASLLGDILSSTLEIPVESKMELIKTVDVKARLKIILKHLNNQIEIMKLRQKLDSHIRSDIGKMQKEFNLRQQLKAIQEELGEIENPQSEAEELEEKVKLIDLPDDVKETALKQIGKLKNMYMGNPDYSVIRVYIDWLLELPWKNSTVDKTELNRVKQILDEDHYGLEKIKERIVGYLAVRKLKSDSKTPILCFVGPPGVGKTSLGKSIARAMDRKFVRISLGGVNDEAAIRGHRRTYIGALPGRIIQGLKRATSNNPVFMIDEIDKIGTNFKGDPAAALLEVLDPEQNYSFSDHYIELPFDLSKILFITTANILEPVPLPLKDRMEIIEIPGYTRFEKLQIALRHLIPKQVSDNGMNSKHIIFSEESIYKIIDSYTREAGVRNLEREIGAICRGVGVKIAENQIDKSQYPVKIKPEDTEEYLGPVKYIPELTEMTSIPGVAIGIINTMFGGLVVFVEATKMKGNGRILLTGSLGEIMQESASAAISFVKSKSESFNLDEKLFETNDIHIHIPSGGLPKEGPALGLPIFVAYLSLLTDRKVRSDVAMTGEITLRGKVLAVDGIKEKILAAHQAKIKNIIIPSSNQPEVEEVPKEIRTELNFIFINDMNDIISHVLEKSE